MRIFKKISVLVLSIIILWIALNSLVIGTSKKGVVVDSATNKPLEGIRLVRETNIILPGFHGSTERTIRVVDTLTNKNGEFYFSSFLKLKSPFGATYRELLVINSGKYYDEKGNFVDLKNNVAYFGDTYGLGFSDGLVLRIRQPYRQGEVTYKPFNNFNVVNLAPIVSVLSECSNDSECLERNNESARSCIMTSIRTEGSTCNDFSLNGTMILKNSKSFGEDISNDFAECNKKTDDVDGALCFINALSFLNVVISESTCSSLSHETARNICYLNIATSSASKPLCDRITKKQIPDVPPLSASRHAYEGVYDYSTLCFKERARKFGQ